MVSLHPHTLVPLQDPQLDEELSPGCEGWPSSCQHPATRVAHFRPIRGVRRDCHPGFLLLCDGCGLLLEEHDRLAGDESHLWSCYRCNAIVQYLGQQAI